MLQYCPRHRLGYNDDLDPVCPQCTLAGIVPPDPWDVDTDPASPTYRLPKVPLGTVAPRNLRKV